MPEREVKANSSKPNLPLSSIQKPSKPSRFKNTYKKDSPLEEEIENIFNANSPSKTEMEKLPLSMDTENLWREKQNGRHFESGFEKVALVHLKANSSYERKSISPSLIDYERQNIQSPKILNQNPKDFPRTYQNQSKSAFERNYLNALNDSNSFMNLSTKPQNGLKNARELQSSPKSAFERVPLVHLVSGKSKSPSPLPRPNSKYFF